MLWFSVVAAVFFFTEVGLARDIDSGLWLQGLAFALALGGAFSGVGALGFVVKAGKAYLIGPNPTYVNVGDDLPVT
jgi:hypothetical protein